MSETAFKGQNCWFGDLHNHCGVSYGHGTPEEAFANARLQLDFCAVVGHAHWPDMPRDEKRLKYLVRFHEEGFAKLRRNKQHLEELTQAHYRSGEFVTFLGFEWHNRAVGDYNIYYRDGKGELPVAADLEELRHFLRRYREHGEEVMLIPHHVGYKTGFRGLDWNSFSPEFSPVVEIFSLHGAAETDEDERPYLHRMGPRDSRGLMCAGLAAGHLFGVYASTDHHSAHPGGYGQGRTAVWASELTREAVWEAIQKRRTVALTGDNIRLAFSLNDRPLGAILEHPAPAREIVAEVESGAPLDYVDLLKNNRLRRRFSPAEGAAARRLPEEGTLRVRLYLEVGWSRQEVEHDWEVHFGVEEGRILSVEPRFRGPDIVAPRSGGATEPPRAVSAWRREDERTVSFRTKTRGNPTTNTPGTQGLSLEVELPVKARVFARFAAGTFPEKREEIPLAELLRGARAGYLGGFGSPAYLLHRASPTAERRARLEILDREEKEPFVSGEDFGGRDCFYVRVRLTNGQRAWSSPIWVPRE